VDLADRLARRKAGVVMKFTSTRGARDKALSFSECLDAGLARDGGLFVPETFPRFQAKDFAELESLPALAERILAPFVEGDALEPMLGAICADAFNFPIPLRPLKKVPPITSVLELFHGPSAAFKDVGARFLAACLSRRPCPNPPNPKSRRTVLVATSGDTGGAVAAAFHGREGFDVVILFPKGRVSARQQRQLTAWGGNVRAIAVRGDFDACQALVKQALADTGFRARHAPVSANSINIGRLLPQTVYYASASLEHQRLYGRPPAGFIVPTGNLGNGVAALWARQMGFATGRICLATNANRAIPEFFSTGVWQPRKTVATLANAMDVGNASNFERLAALHPDLAALTREALSDSVSDQDISDEIRRAAVDGEVWCPHTAVAARVRGRLPEPYWIIVATAHPAKFETIVEPLVGRAVDIPPSLAAVLARPERFSEIEPRLDALLKEVDS
jgi:threonine synthase